MENNVSLLIQSLIKGANSAQSINLEQANALIACVLEKAKQSGVNAVAAVSDFSGNPVSVQCMDSSFIASYDIALNKAFTSVALKISTIQLKPLAQPGGSLYGIQFTNNGRIVIFGGGVPLYNKNGDIIGGLGVSGGTEAQDTALAEFGKNIFDSCTKHIV